MTEVRSDNDSPLPELPSREALILGIQAVLHNHALLDDAGKPSQVEYLVDELIRPLLREVVTGDAEPPTATAT